MKSTSVGCVVKSRRTRPDGTRKIQRKSKQMGSQLNASLKILPEPDLEFRYGQRTQDPHAGLGLFGPYSADSGSHPKSIVYGVIGSPQGVDAMHQWSQLMEQASVEPLEPKRKMGRLVQPDD